MFPRRRQKVCDMSGGGEGLRGHRAAGLSITRVELALTITSQLLLHFLKI